MHQSVMGCLESDFMFFLCVLIGVSLCVVGCRGKELKLTQMSINDMFEVCCASLFDQKINTRKSFEQKKTKRNMKK